MPLPTHYRDLGIWIADPNDVRGVRPYPLPSGEIPPCEVRLRLLPSGVERRLFGYPVLHAQSYALVYAPDLETAQRAVIAILVFHVQRPTRKGAP